MNILERIAAQKVEEVAAGKKKYSIADFEQKISTLPPARQFVSALQHKIQSKHPAVIAEIKKASPSQGIIRDNFEPDNIAKSYQSHHAAALSVLTDEIFFHGKLSYLELVHHAVYLPLLRKDFIIEPWQIYQSRASYADCILLIAAMLSTAQLKEYQDIAHSLGMAALVEVHNAEELESALEASAPFIGINNRDLKTFDVSLDVTIELLDRCPDNVTLVTESGIHTVEDVQRMRAHNINAFLVGERFMRDPNPGRALQQLFFQESPYATT